MKKRVAEIFHQLFYLCGDKIVWNGIFNNQFDQLKITDAEFLFGRKRLQRKNLDEAVGRRCDMSHVKVW
ncbi:hypothetical protein NECAME_13736 [Necator americanus]|uniref:Uncharacterized protein n=1 Tax=Necator americanus TaxID=51031 RepID=W2SVH3_NECAM|nr:hypothetical protein NECAME_13736 [Necator americanus]ETN72786.1 hypothetical protein NECAME_13736 [Necator americanus]